MTTRTDGEAPMDDIRQLETPADSTEPTIETRQREPDQVEAPEVRKPELQYGSAADRKRQAINERTQRQMEEERGAKIERADETERMMGGKNLQTRADREAADAAERTEGASEITPEDIPAPRLVRLKVNGEERDVDEDEVRAYAQIALSSQDILNQAKQAKIAAQQELAELQRLRADHSRSQQEQPAPAPKAKAEDTKPATDEELDSLIEAIQTGEIEDAKKALTQYGDQIERRIQSKIGDIDQRITATIRQTQEDARVQNETQQVLDSFARENDDFTSSPKRMKVLVDETVDVMRENLSALNVSDETIASIASKYNVAPQIAVGMATRFLRGQGYELPDNAAVMRTAVKRVRESFGMPDPSARKETAPKVDPTSSILAERDARKQAMAPQPRRANITPGNDQGPAKSREELAREHIRAVKVSRRRY